MNINRRQIFRDFDPMTCIAAALAAAEEAGQ